MRESAALATASPDYPTSCPKARKTSLVVYWLPLDVLGLQCTRSPRDAIAVGCNRTGDSAHCHQCRRRRHTNWKPRRFSGGIGGAVGHSGRDRSEVDAYRRNRTLADGNWDNSARRLGTEARRMDSMG